MKTKSLADLYVRGRLVTVEGPVMSEDGSHVDTVAMQVFVKKMNTTENEEAARKANAARARLLAACKDPDSDESLAALNEVMDKDREELIEDLISDELAKRVEAAEAEIGQEDEWSEDNYLQGLYDAWRESAHDVWQNSRDVEEPENPEEVAAAERVYAELTRFRDLVDKAVADHAVALRRDWDDVDDDEIIRKAHVFAMKMRAEMIWLEEYRRMEVCIGVRDPEDHKQRVFTRQNLDDLELPVLLELMKAQRDLNVDPMEGKDSQETPSS